MENMNHEDYRLAAIVFTDIVGFSRMMEKSEMDTLKLLQKHNTVIESIVARHGGHIIKTIGDAYLIDFKTSANAVACSVDIQNEMMDLNHTLSDDKKLYLRIGVHMGDVWFFKNDALGEAINIAARLQSLCRPGKICISQDIYHQILNKIDLEMIGLGKVKLKNITKEIQAFEITTRASEEYRILEEKNQEKLGKILEKEKPELPFESSEKNKTIAEEQIQSEIIQNLKIANTRISLNGFQKLFNIPEKNLQKMLNHLTDMGLLLKLEKENGETEFGLGNFKKLVQGESKDQFKEEILKGMKEHHFGNSNIEQEIKKKIEEKLTRIAERPRKKTIRERINGLLKKVNGVIHSFIPGVIAFPLFAGLFYFLNLHFFTEIPWAFGLMFFMGTGLVSHFFKFFVSLDQRNAIEKIPEKPNRNHYHLIKKYLENSNGVAGHFGTYSFFGMGLVLMNMLSHPGLFANLHAEDLVKKLSEYPIFSGFFNTPFFQWLTTLNDYWCILPLAIWGGIFAIQFLASIPYRNQLLKKIDDAGLEEESEEDAEVEEKIITKSEPAKKQEEPQEKKIDEMDLLLSQCEKIKNGILDKISQNPGLQEKMDENMGEIIRNHLDTVIQLKRRNDQIEKILVQHSVEDISGQIKALETRREETQSEELKEEYGKSISQLIRQKNTMIELFNQKEMNELKMTGAVTSLKQLELDLANMNEILSDQTETSIRIFEERARDLGKYVNNLKTSYRELDKEL